ncbi:MAG: hypothetical protein ABI230_06690 [Aestuariivirga sp.]
MEFFSRFKRVFFTFGGIFGTLSILWRPAQWLLGRLSDVDTIRSHYDQLVPFLNSPIATLISIAIGFGLLVRAVYKTSLPAGGGANPSRFTFEGAAVPRDKTAIVPESKTGLVWNGDSIRGYLCLGLMQTDGKTVIKQFQYAGRNLTPDPIVKVRGYLRSDKTNIEYPTFFNLLGDPRPPDDLNPIPVGAIIDTVTFFRPDREPIPIEQFLGEDVPFTFFFDYDGETYRRTFTLAELEPQIRDYEKTMRDQAIKPPQMSAKVKQ